MRLSRLQLRQRKTFPFNRGILNEKFETSVGPPRAKPKNPNDHFGQASLGDRGAENNSFNRLNYGFVGGLQVPRQSEYTKLNHREDPRLGRVSKFDPDYIHFQESLPIYSRIPESIASQTIVDHKLIEKSKLLDDKREWYQSNWMKLDLIDPAKWAIFPGDVVKVVRKSHPDYRKFGVVQSIDIALGFVTVVGINVTSLGTDHHSKNTIYSEPLPYRDLKILKYGHSLVNFINSDVQGNVDDVLKESVPNGKKIEVLEKEIKSIFENAERNDQHVLDFLDEWNLLKTINVRMKYSNFCEEEFDLKSWDELGAKRLDGDMLDDYDHEYEIQLPKKICEGNPGYGDKSDFFLEPNHMTAAEFNNVCDDQNMWNLRLNWENIPTEEQRTVKLPYASLSYLKNETEEKEVEKQRWQDVIREHRSNLTGNDLRIKPEERKIFHYRNEVDKYD